MSNLKPATGDLKHRITLRKWEDRADHGFAIKQKFEEGIKLFAGRYPVSGAKYIGSKQVEQTITDLWKVRYWEGIVDEQSVTTDYVIDYKNARFRVKRVTPFEGGREFVWIETESIGKIT